MVSKKEVTYGLRSALIECANQFRDYEKSHIAKDTLDGLRKAVRNREMREMCEAAIKAFDEVSTQEPITDIVHNWEWAQQAMANGGKLRRKEWKPGAYVCQLGSQIMVNSGKDGKLTRAFPGASDMNATDWELFEKAPEITTEVPVANDAAPAGIDYGEGGLSYGDAVQAVEAGDGTKAQRKEWKPSVYIYMPFASDGKIRKAIGGNQSVPWIPTKEDARAKDWELIA